MNIEIIEDIERLHIVDLIGEVDVQPLQIGGDAALADAFGDGAALGFQFACFVIAVERRAERVGEADLHLCVTRLQRRGDARQRAAAADRADKSVHLAVRLVPDFRARRVDMTLPVGDIVELIGPDRPARVGFRQFFCQSAGIFDIIIRVLVGFRRDKAQIRSAIAQQGLFLIGLGFGHDDHGFIAARIGDQREADARIARRALNNQPAGSEQALRLRILDDGERRAVLDRAAGIEEFGLAVDVAARRLRRGGKADKRRVADAVDEIFADFHGEV